MQYDIYIYVIRQLKVKYQVSQISLYQDCEALIFDCFHMHSVFLCATAGNTQGTYNKLNNFCGSSSLAAVGCK